MLNVNKHDGVLEVVLNNGKVNAIGLEMSRQMGQILADFKADPTCHVAIISGGDGKIFSAGWDLKSVAEDSIDEFEDYGVGGFAGLTEMFDLNKPVIAAVNGTAVGAGVELALACDLIVAANSAEFFLPETRLGVLADVGGVQRLPRKIPENFAMEMLLTGRKMNSEEGLNFGLFNYVVPKGEVMDKARELAKQLCDSAPLAVKAIKEVIHETLHLSVEESFRRVKRLQFPTYVAMLNSEDREEGPKAFAEKRSPKWKGY